MQYFSGAQPVVVINDAEMARWSAASLYVACMEVLHALSVSNMTGGIIVTHMRFSTLSHMRTCQYLHLPIGDEN